MPWKPLPRIAFAIAIYPFQVSSPAELPLQLGDELYIIEEGGQTGEWYRGYLVAPPSLLSGLTAGPGKTLEARVFSGIFPKHCVQVRELLADSADDAVDNDGPDKKGEEDADGILELDSRRFNDEDEMSVLSSPKTPRALVPKREESDYFNKRDSFATPRLSTAHSTPTPDRKSSTFQKPLAPVPMLKIGDETPTSASEPLVDEIAACLREWHSAKIHQLLLDRDYATLEKLVEIITDLDFSRKQLLYNVLTAKERAALHQEAVWKLVKGNKLIGGEIIVRDPFQAGRLLVAGDSAVQLAKLQAEMSMLQGPSNPPHEQEPITALLCELTSIKNLHPNTTAIGISLMLKSTGKDLYPLTETFLADISSSDSAAKAVELLKMKTLFSELSSSDFSGSSSVYLVVKIFGIETVTVESNPHARSIPSTKQSTISKAAKPVTNSVRTRKSLAWTWKGNSSSPDEQIALPGGTFSNFSEDVINSDKSATPKKEKYLKRIVGVGVLDVTPFWKERKTTEETIAIWSLASSRADTQTIDEVTKSLLCHPSNAYSRTTPPARISILLSPTPSEDADSIVRNNSGPLHRVVPTRRIGFTGTPDSSRSDIYITLSRASILPDSILSHPIEGQIPAPIGHLQNLQVTLEVRNINGQRIENCIHAVSNGSARTAWRTTCTERGSIWNQTIRLNIPKDEVLGSHVIMVLANAPEPPFALCYLPLRDDQAFVRDGPHALLLHAYDKTTAAVGQGKGAYLSLPWNALGKKDETVTGPSATLNILINLCSTEFSTDKSLLALFNWKDLRQSEIEDVLRQVAFISEIEIVKKANDVFDALFGILVDNTGIDEIEKLAFNCLVTVLAITQSGRYGLAPLLDNYIDDHFNFSFASPALVRSFSRLLPAEAESEAHHHRDRDLRSTFKVGQYIFKFITKAREQQAAKEEGIGVTKVKSTFNRDLQSMFQRIEKLMQNQAPIHVGTKTLVVQRFHTWLPELSRVFSPEDVVQTAFNFMSACAECKGMMILYKLILIVHYINLPLFQEQNARQALLSHIKDWIAPYWGETDKVTDQYRDQVRLCSTIVSELLKKPDPSMYEYMPKIVQSHLAIVREGVDETEYLSLLFSKSFPFQTRPSKSKQVFDEILVELAALMASISQIPDPKPLPCSRMEMRTYLMQLMRVNTSILNCEAYPRTWFSFHICQHQAIIKSLEHVSTVLVDMFLPSPENAEDFDTDLWKQFFIAIYQLVSSGELTLESFPEQKRRAIWKIAGDVRQRGADLLSRTWNAIGWDAVPSEQEMFGLNKLGGYQVQYVPSLVWQFVELCLCMHDGLRMVAVDILRTVIVSEWQLNQDLSVVEAEVIASLDSLFKTKNLTERPNLKLFVRELEELFENVLCNSTDKFAVNIRALLTTISELLDLLVSSHNGNITESLNTLKLMEFMKDVEKEDIFIRYVHELARSQSATRNFTEAGLALQFHADLYDWKNPRMCSALTYPPLPCQSSLERKEGLYYQIITYFEQGKAWAMALSCYEELAKYYERITMDFSKLARTMTSMGKIYEAITNNDRTYPRHFYVEFLGFGFPDSLRQKAYIFEAAPSDHTVTFTDRLQKLYPSAQLAATSDVPDLEGQYLNVSSIAVHRDISHAVYQRPEISQPVREHLLVSSPSTFSTATKRNTKGKKVKEHWVVRTTYTTAEPFPNILRRSEIVDVEEVTLDPIETAIDRTWRKTQELLLFHQRAAMGGETQLRALAEALKHVLDSDSDSSPSVAHYHQFFRDNNPATLNSATDLGSPDLCQEPQLNVLKVTLIDHAAVVKRCLALFARPAHSYIYNELKYVFEDLFAYELSFLASATYSATAASGYGSRVEEPLSATTNISSGFGSQTSSRVVSNTINPLTTFPPSYPPTMVSETKSGV